MPAANLARRSKLNPTVGELPSRVAIQMDMLEELNSLASRAQCSDTVDQLEDAVPRWMNLFGYGSEEATDRITEQRLDLVNGLVSEDLWSIAQSSGEVAGHDRESYTHFLKTCRYQHCTVSSQQAVLPDEEYLFRLGGLIASAEQLQHVASLSALPLVHTGLSTEDENTSAHFCLVNTQTKQIISDWYAEHKKPCPDFIFVSIAPKDLSDHCIAPTLGRTSTMPQHRMADDLDTPPPRQNEYPVWYFFYGTLQDPEKLRLVFSGSQTDTYIFRHAKISGGKLVEWGGKYKALVDAPTKSGFGSGESVVNGSAFLVETKDQEDALRMYETKAYEVVRCTIEFEDESLHGVAGCTFRYRGR